MQPTKGSFAVSDHHLSQLADTARELAERRLAFSSLAAARRDSKAIAQSSELSSYIADLLRLAGEKKDEARLTAVAELIRIRQTFKPRAREIHNHLPRALENALPALSALSDAKDREYVAMALADAGGAWVADYCAGSAMEEETAERAREELLIRLFERTGVVEGVRALGRHSDRMTLAADNAAESAARRAARILAAVMSSTATLEVRPTEGFAEGIGELVRAVFARSGFPGPGEPRHQVLVQLVRTVSWTARSRASLAVLPETYIPLRVFQRSYGSVGWDEKAKGVLMPLVEDLEDALLLQGRQGIPSAGLAELLRAVVGNPGVARERLARLADAHPELPETIRHWFRRGELRTSASDEGAFGGGTLAALDVRIADALLAHRQTLLGSNQERKLARLVQDEEAVADPVFGAALQGSRDAWQAIGMLVQDMAALRELAVRGEAGAMDEFDPKYFEPLAPVRPRMQVVRAAVIRRGADGRDGECIRRGTMI